MSSLLFAFLPWTSDNHNMADPNPLLSTLTQSSAVMVAIIGGFLVSKLVALSSERAGITRQLRMAEQRLALIKADYEPAHQYRLENSQSAFFDFVLDDLIKAEADEVDYEALVAEHVPRGSSYEEMLPYAEALHKRVKEAFASILQAIRDDDTDLVDLSDLRQRGLVVPEEDEALYESVMEHVADRLPSPRTSWPAVPALRMPVVTPAWVHEVDARRLDDSIREETQLKAEMVATEHEVRRLRVDLDKIGQPVGVIPAVWILSLLSLLGIVVPVVVMAFHPDELQGWQSALLVSFFVVGLISVLGYILWYLQHLDSDTE